MDFPFISLSVHSRVHGIACDVEMLYHTLPFDVCEGYTTSQHDNFVSILYIMMLTKSVISSGLAFTLKSSDSTIVFV